MDLDQQPELVRCVWCASVAVRYPSLALSLDFFLKFRGSTKNWVLWV